MAPSSKKIVRAAVKKTASKQKPVMVIGAGVAGASVALQLGRAGCEVHLVEKQAGIGGHAVEMGCKATDKCQRCNVCVANDVLNDVTACTNVHIHTGTELLKLESGNNGSRYGAVVVSQPGFIDRVRCIGCGACVQSCPKKAISVTNPGISPAVPVLDTSACLRSRGRDCSKCQDACPAKAIDLKQKRVTRRMDVDTVIIATGYDPYNPGEDNSYGYGRVTNVITGIEAERQLAGQHKITRPSDGRAAKHIAFIQCVGSRTAQVHRRPEDTDYCSTVCCAYALRMAKLIKHQADDAQITVFYMDIQNFGKGFNEFYNECRDKMTFVRSRPYEINEGPQQTVIVEYTPETGLSEAGTGLCQGEFDLVILAVGIRPNADMRSLADKLLVGMDEAGFVGLKGASALPNVQREGIFVVGTAESPKDIAGCMADAQAVAAAVISED